MQKTRRVLVDNLDGSPDATTVQFGLDGRFYEIDLSAANAERLRHVFARYVERARAVGRAPTDRREPASTQRGATGATRKTAHKDARHVGHRGGSGPSARTTARHASGERVLGGSPAAAPVPPTPSRPTSRDEPARAGSARSPGAAQDVVPGEVRRAVLDVLAALHTVLGSLGTRRGPGRE